MSTDSQRNDADIIKLVRGGEQEKYELLIQKYQGALYRHAFGMVADSDAASDLVQDAFIKAYKNISRLDEPEKFKSWIFRILTNLCKDYLKNRRQNTVDIEKSSLIAPKKDEAYFRQEQTEIQSAIENALSKLPQEQKEAFLMKHVEGMSYDEIGEILGVSVSALKMRVLRARQSLQELLQALK